MGAPGPYAWNRARLSIVSVYQSVSVALIRWSGSMEVVSRISQNPISDLVEAHRRLLRRRAGQGA